MEKLLDIGKIIKGKNAEDILRALSELKNEKIVFSSSLSYEDQIITHMIFSQDLNISVFTLDTGRLFPETYSVLSSTLNRYKKQIQVYYPDTKAAQDLVTNKGPFSFYDSPENRKECCFIRKVEPLKRALSGKTIWVTGIRAEHSEGRNNMGVAEWDESNNLIKVHPIFNWSTEQVKEYIKKNNIPYNPLHDKGFISIGCQPCTRSVKEGENFRAGRWWWEDNSKKECGLHS